MSDPAKEGLALMLFFCTGVVAGALAVYAFLQIG